MGSVLNWLTGWGSPPLRHGHVLLRQPNLAHFAAWAELRRASRHHLVPFEPAWAEDELTRAAFRRRLRRYRSDCRRGTGDAYFVFSQTEKALVGGVTLTNIRHGVTSSASVGYWIGAHFVRRGYASSSVAAIVDHCFRDLGLNRVEAACMPRNRASIAVLERAGFRQEGLARRYLRINGVFEDHLLFACLKDDVAQSASQGEDWQGMAFRHVPAAAAAYAIGEEATNNGHTVGERAR